MDNVLSEVYATVTAMGEQYIKRIPKDVWAKIIAHKNDDYTPYVDENKRLSQQGLAEDTITFIAMLYRDYWCDTEEERRSLLALFAKNEEGWQAKLSQTSSIRNLLKMSHKK